MACSIPYPIKGDGETSPCSHSSYAKTSIGRCSGTTVGAVLLYERLLFPPPPCRRLRNGLCWSILRRSCTQRVLEVLLPSAIFHSA